MNSRISSTAGNGHWYIYISQIRDNSLVIKYLNILKQIIVFVDMFQYVKLVGEFFSFQFTFDLQQLRS